jgi:D-hexose-6-phosphate mutarotase
MKLKNYRKLPYWALHTYFDMVCLRNICVNTLHKGDSIFTNNNNNNNNNNNRKNENYTPAGKLTNTPTYKQ